MKSLLAFTCVSCPRWTTLNDRGSSRIMINVKQSETQAQFGVSTTQNEMSTIKDGMTSPMWQRSTRAPHAHITPTRTHSQYYYTIGSTSWFADCGLILPLATWWGWCVKHTLGGAVLYLKWSRMQQWEMNEYWRRKVPTLFVVTHTWICLSDFL